MSAWIGRSSQLGLLEIWFTAWSHSQIKFLCYKKMWKNRPKCVQIWSFYSARKKYFLTQVWSAFDVALMNKVGAEIINLRYRAGNISPAKTYLGCPRYFSKFIYPCTCLSQKQNRQNKIGSPSIFLQEKFIKSILALVNLSEKYSCLSKNTLGMPSILQ